MTRAGAGKRPTDGGRWPRIALLSKAPDSVGNSALVSAIEPSSVVSSWSRFDESAKPASCQPRSSAKISTMFGLSVAANRQRVNSSTIKAINGITCRDLSPADVFQRFSFQIVNPRLPGWTSGKWQVSYNNDRQVTCPAQKRNTTQDPQL